jgi:hypothetical protein
MHVKLGQIKYSAYPQNSSIPDENWLDTLSPDMFDRFNAS